MIQSKAQSSRATPFRLSMLIVPYIEFLDSWLAYLANIPYDEMTVLGSSPIHTLTVAINQGENSGCFG